MNGNNNDLRMLISEITGNLWKRVLAMFSGTDDRLTALESRVSALDGQTTNNTNPDTSGD